MLCRTKRPPHITICSTHGVKTVQVNDAYTHQKLGHYAFDTIKNGSSEVYYGEWFGKEYAKVTNRGVYYSGDKRATQMPVSGVANYAVKGINNYTGNNPLTGTLRADLGQKVLTGSIKNNAMQLDIYSRIKPSSASFEGYARANGHYGKPKATSSTTVQARWPVLPNLRPTATWIRHTAA